MTLSLRSARVAGMVLLAAGTLAACTPTDQSTAIGAAGGALIGRAVSSDHDKTQGTVIGAMAGLVAGNLIGQARQPGQCYYSDGRGGRYTAACQ